MTKTYFDIGKNLEKYEIQSVEEAEFDDIKKHMVVVTNIGGG